MTRITNTMIALVAVACLTGSAFATNVVSALTSMRAMEKVFMRSEKAHLSSMAKISRSMTSPEKALEVLHEKNSTTPALLQVAEVAFARKNLRRKDDPKKGLAGVDGARKMLNGMIYESSSKYDGEIAKCTEFYSKQCALMQAARGEIAASNYIAANSRMRILDSQSGITRCEDIIPTKKMELNQHNTKCKNEQTKMNQRLKVIMQDIAVMTAILKMTDCAKSMMQKVGLMKCHDECSKTSFISFKHKGLQQQMSQLQSSLSHSLTADSMKDFFEGVKGIQSIEFQVTQGQAPSTANKTDFNKPPKPRTEVAANPCNDPNQGAPSAATKRAAKCTLAKSPQCFKMQERFLLIQSGIQDERDDLLEEIAKLENSCEETKNTLETQVQNTEAELGNGQTKLAAATEQEATASETARQTSKSFNQMNDELVQTMKTCSTNYINFETELCALKKIRGELYKMATKEAYFVDCSVSKWDQEECSAKCGGGSMKLVRGVVTHPNGGAKCLPLEAMRSCNLNPCPIDCKLHAWAGWSKCSAECGGGVQQRLRDVKHPMRFNGKPCGATSETKACNAEACEVDCVLGRWTKWDACTKDCDGGTRKRVKFIQTPSVGDGNCAGKWDKARLEYKECNMRRCVVPAGAKVMECKAELDVVLLLDGSGSLGQAGWDAEIVAAHHFVTAFENKGSKAMLSVILFSGPKTWSGVDKCVGKSSANKNVDMSKCGIETVTHFTDNMANVRAAIDELMYPKGSTLTSLALATAKAELNLGRKDAKSAVIVFTDGRPLSYRKTYLASKELRKSARLIWVPITARAPLAFIKKVATRRWQENIVLAKDYKTLASPDVVNHLVANMCPKPPSKLVDTVPLLNGP